MRLLMIDARDDDGLMEDGGDEEGYIGVSLFFRAMGSRATRDARRDETTDDGRFVGLTARRIDLANEGGAERWEGRVRFGFGFRRGGSVEIGE